MINLFRLKKEGGILESELRVMANVMSISKGESKEKYSLIVPVENDTFASKSLVERNLV